MPAGTGTVGASSPGMIGHIKRNKTKELISSLQVFIFGDMVLAEIIIVQMTLSPTKQIMETMF